MSLYTHLMKHQVKIISFGPLIILSFLSFILTMALFLSLENKLPYWTLLVLNGAIILLLNLLFTGSIKFEFKQDSFTIEFLKKPLITFIPEGEFLFSEIKKWDHFSYNQGPDALIIRLKSKKKIRITFRLFALKNDYHSLLSNFKEWVNENRDRNRLSEYEAYNMTEQFYSSKKAKYAGYVLYTLFILDFLLMIINAWDHRKLFALLLIPLTFSGMMFIVQLQLFRKKKKN